MFELWYVDAWLDDAQEPAGFGVCLDTGLDALSAMLLLEPYDRIGAARYGPGMAVVLNRGGVRVPLAHLWRALGTPQEALETDHRLLATG